MKDFIAYNERVWVDPIEIPNETESGIVISIDKEKPTRGVVVAIGVLCDMDLLGDLKVGDTVLFQAHHPLEIEIKGRTYLTILDRNVEAII